MPRLGLRRPRTAIERLYPHPLHQRLHVTTAGLAPLGSQQASQHPAPGEGELQMQSVKAPHDRKVGFRHRARQVIDATPANVQRPRLPGDRQIVRAVDHRFALSRPALLSAPSKKSFSSVSSPILACNDFTSTAGCAVPLPPWDRKHRQPRPRAALSTMWSDWGGRRLLDSAKLYGDRIAIDGRKCQAFALKAGVWFRRGVCSCFS